MAAIGILDLQGGVVEHLEHLKRLQVPVVRVKRAEDFQNLAGLIIPGGESTCLGRLLRLSQLDRVIKERYTAGLKLWGTCAGAILLARTVVGEAPYLALMDITVERNAFGSQIDSFNLEAVVQAMDTDPIPLTFIRAPKISHLGKEVRPILEVEGYIAAAETTEILVTIFHPELTPSLAFHRYFARKCGIQTKDDNLGNWDRESWLQYAPIP